MIKPPLFVYGSLRRGAGGHGRLRALAHCLGEASIAARLYDLGPYPAAVPADHPGERMHGEFCRPTLPATLARPDRCEACDRTEPPAAECRCECVPVQWCGGCARVWLDGCTRPLRDARPLPRDHWGHA
ncbi:MAG: hypothetical protein Kow0073_19800 [Immundisolibacter sp.]